MNIAGVLLKKTLTNSDLAQVSFKVAVLEKYLSSAKVMRTNTVGRIKASSWSLDFGIAPDEKSVHVALGDLMRKLPEAERDHWLCHASASRYSENYLKMQASHACIDDGALAPLGRSGRRKPLRLKWQFLVSCERDFKNSQDRQDRVRMKQDWKRAVFSSFHDILPILLPSRISCEFLCFC